MPMKRTYDTVDGQILSETASGKPRYYVADALGSVTGVSQSGTISGAARYSPYGRTIAGSSGAVGGWGWSWGYYPTGRAFASHYVRARVYDNTSGTWTTIDQLWPWQSPFGYVRCNPTSKRDPSGKQPHLDKVSCGGQTGFGSIDNMNGCIDLFCKAVAKGNDTLWNKIKGCVDRLNQHLDDPKNAITRDCLQTMFCNNDSFAITCGPCDDTNDSTCTNPKCFGKKFKLATQCGHTTCSPTKTSITMCTNAGCEYIWSICGRTEFCDSKCDNGTLSIMHEIGHVCSHCDPAGGRQGHQAAFDEFARCLMANLGCKSY